MRTRDTNVFMKQRKYDHRCCESTSDGIVFLFHWFILNFDRSTANRSTVDNGQFYSSPWCATQFDCFFLLWSAHLWCQKKNKKNRKFICPNINEDRYSVYYIFKLCLSYLFLNPFRLYNCFSFCVSLHFLRRRKKKFTQRENKCAMFLKNREIRKIQSDKNVLFGFCTLSHTPAHALNQSSHRTQSDK